MAAQKGREIDLFQVPFEQLDQIKTQLEQEITEMTTSWRKLKEAQVRYEGSKDTLGVVRVKEGTEILVPLTASLYVPGTIAESNRVLVDIGTGYYAEKSVAGAKALLDRKISFVTENADLIRKTVIQKQNDAQTVVSVMKQRLNQQQQQQQQQQQAQQSEAES